MYAAPNIIADNESPDCQNVESTNEGSIQTRYGTRWVNSGQTLPSARWYGGAAFQPNSGGSLIVGWYGTDMLVASAATNLTFATVPSAQSVFTAGTHVAHGYYNGYMFMCMPNGTPYKYDGSEFTRWGIETPSAAFSLATAATAGPLSGTYQYVVAYVNSAGVVGDISSALTVSIGPSAVVSIASIPTAPQSYGVASRYLYRTLDGGNQFFFLDELANNTATTYSDESPDADLGEAADLDVGYPPSARLLAVHKDRIWAVDNTDKAILSYSEVGNPYVWRAAGFEAIGEGAGSINVLGVHNDGIVNVKDTGECVLLFVGDNNPENFLPISVDVPFGTGSRFGVQYENSFMYLGTFDSRPFNFVSLYANQVVNETITTDTSQTTSRSISQRIEPRIQGFFNQDLINDVTGISWRDRVFISVAENTATATATINNRVWQFDYFRRSTPTQIGGWFPFTSMFINYFVAYDNRLFGFVSGSNSPGRVVELDVESRYSDDTFDSDSVWTVGRAIDSYFYTKRYGMGQDREQNHKDFRYAYIWADLLGDYEMNVRARIDFQAGPGLLTSIDLNPIGTVYDTFLYDTGVYDQAYGEKEFDVDNGTLSGRRIQYRFDNQNTVNQAFKVNRMTIEYLLRPRIPIIAGV